MADDSDVTVQTEPELEQQIRTKLEEEYNSRLQEEIQKTSNRLIEENKKLVNETIERLRKEMAPPSEQDLQKLLDQEYLEFTIELPVKGRKRKFTLKELPIAVEKKMFRKIKDILVPFSSELAALTVNMLEGDAGKKMVQLMNAFEPVLDVMIALCAICLNPYEEEEDITEEWVREHIGVTRMVKIVTVQLEVNKMRDFFSLLFHSTRSMTR